MIFILENSYASNGVKHCIRPCDMTGKSSALILRQMHPNMISEADKYDLFVDFPSWFSSISLHENSISYAHQKSIESDFLLKISERKIKKLDDNQNNVEIKEMVNDVLEAVEMFNQDIPSLKNKRKKKDY